ncbi:PglL family O-oligosaccharyltransferase [Polaromonas aquatica]|uniref:PglL family O-oligosaccharyltransferase n=1 Tax=Polaromonas aquatica TaxID=332657 RepID=A0ABW1TVF4_9BURK
MKFAPPVIAVNAPVGILMAVLVLLPWLSPLAPGPSPSVVPWLLALGATAGLLLCHSLLAWRGHGAGHRSFTQIWAAPAAWAWVIAGALSSVMGLLQYFGATAGLEPWLNHARFGEAFANLRQRNQFATLTNVALAALLWFAMAISSSLQADALTVRRREAMVLVVTGLLAVGNAASLSRTGLVQLFLLCALCAVWGGWRLTLIRRMLVVAVLTYVVATFVLPWSAGFDPSLHGMAARLRSGDEACASRITLWSNVLQLIAQKPWLGWGWGELDYAHYMTLYSGLRFCEILDNAHNLPLHLAVELGIPVAMAACATLAWWVMRQRPWRETDPARQLAWSVVAVILLHSLLEYPLWYGPFQMAFGLCAGLLWCRPAQAENSSGGPKIQPNSHLATVFPACIAIFLIVSVIYAAWDYHRVSQIYLPPQERDVAYRDDTLSKIQGSWLYADQARFAQLMLTPLARENASWTFNTANALLHYSPEPRVIQKVIESAVMLGLNDVAMAHLARYKAAFPNEYAQWAKENSRYLPLKAPVP